MEMLAWPLGLKFGSFVSVPGLLIRSLSGDVGYVQWQTLAETAEAKSCYWRFVLLHLEILQAHIFEDGIAGEIAEIEALLEEAAELVDESQPKNAKYYR